MSLIERAIERIGNRGQSPSPSPRKPDNRQEPRRSSAAPAEAEAPAQAAVGQRQDLEASADRLMRIELDAMRARGMLTPDSDQHGLAQEFRVIKRPLLANAFGRGAAPVKNGKRVMVTSTFPGEGKSFCAVNLAMSIASERDNQVLLVDADVARPSLPGIMGVTVKRGLMDLVLDERRDVAEFVYPTNVDKLAFLPAGRRHQHATELLASDAMRRRLEQLTARYPDRIIIFDSPPLLVTTEARVLASHMGQIVMVVEAERTPRGAVKDALATIESSEVVGLVLNKSRGNDSGGYFNYYGYGYGYGG